jgi:hypothetical protein
MGYTTKAISKMIAFTAKEPFTMASTGQLTPDSGFIINSMGKDHSTTNFQLPSTELSITAISIKLINAGSNFKVLNIKFRIIHQ